MKISLIDMGKTKKRNVRESIISILSRNFPLSIRKIYNYVKKDYHLDVTYQAVFKLVKEMLDDGILQGENKEYKLNMGWIKQLEEELNIIKHKYHSSNKDISAKTKQEIEAFVSSVGPKLKEYAGKDKLCILSASGGGRLFGMSLWKYLLREGLDVKYIHINPFDNNSVYFSASDKNDIKSRRVIYVDRAIHSGKTYEVVMNRLSKIKKSLKIIDIKCAVDEDQAGLADFSITRI